MRNITKLPAEHKLKDRESYNTRRERWFRNVLSDPEMPPTTKVALIGVGLHFNQEEYDKRGVLRAFPSERTLGEVLGADRRTVRRALKKAEGIHLHIKRGFREDGSHDVHQYTPLFASVGGGRISAGRWARSGRGVAAILQGGGGNFVPITSEVTSDITSDITSERSYEVEAREAAFGGASEGKEPSSATHNNFFNEARKGWPERSEGQQQKVNSPPGGGRGVAAVLVPRRIEIERDELKLRRMRLDNLSARLLRCAPKDERGRSDGLMGYVAGVVAEQLRGLK